LGYQHSQSAEEDIITILTAAHRRFGAKQAKHYAQVIEKNEISQ